MTGEEMKASLVELGWKQVDLCRRIEMNKNTVSAWAVSGPPAWVGEYLGAVLAIDRLHQEFVRPVKPEAASPPAPAEKQRRMNRAANMAKRLKADPDLFPSSGAG